MKKNVIIIVIGLMLLTVIGFFLISTIYEQDETKKIEKILQRLDEIKTASYYTKRASSAPGDTLTFNTYERYIIEYINSTDTILGASFSMAPVNAPNKIEMCYDGEYIVRINWMNKNAQIDSLALNPRRRPYAPFFVRVNSLLKYTKDNIDSSTVQYFKYKDSIKIDISFKDKIVEFNRLNPSVRESVGQISRYEIFVNRSNIPYKLIRKMPYQRSWETCTDIQVYQHQDFVFSSIQQIPVGFEIGETEINPEISYELEGEIAPDWKLKEIYGDSISLNQLKQKVILIQFTGIGCGPCHESIPFLKKLTVDYKNKDFELICIETWSDNIAGIKRYKDKNELNYKFLVSGNNIKDKYKILGVPSFFILDDNKVIKKVIVGYRKGVTDNEIIRTIDNLL